MKFVPGKLTDLESRLGSVQSINIHLDFFILRWFRLLMIGSFNKVLSPFEGVFKITMIYFIYCDKANKQKLCKAEYNLNLPVYEIAFKA